MIFGLEQNTHVLQASIVQFLSATKRDLTPLNINSLTTFPIVSSACLTIILIKLQMESSTIAICNSVVSSVFKVHGHSLVSVSNVLSYFSQYFWTVVAASRSLPYWWGNNCLRFSSADFHAIPYGTNWRHNTLVLCVHHEPLKSVDRSQSTVAQTHHQSVFILSSLKFFLLN